MSGEARLDSTKAPSGAATITAALRAAREEGRPGLVAFATAGYPRREDFRALVASLAQAADVLEIGVPFSDPMADGVTIQRSSMAALEQGVSLAWILDELAALERPAAAPLVLMSYLNPLVAYGLERLARRAREAGVAGFIVPDLPLEESAPLCEAFESEGLALVQLVTPVTPDARLAELASASRGFVYAVTTTGTTGGRGALSAEVTTYLDRVRARSALPVCAGFGIRTREQVEALAPHADGLIVGSALVECLERGEDPAAFLRGLAGEE